MRTCKGDAGTSGAALWEYMYVHHVSEHMAVTEWLLWRGPSYAYSFVRKPARARPGRSVGGGEAPGKLQVAS